MDKRIKKKCVHIHNGILFSHQKNELLSFVTAWMELIKLNAVGQAQKDMDMVLLPCGI